MDESIKTLKCPKCGRENEIPAIICSAIPCRFRLKPELECLRSIDVSLITIRRIATWWLILSIAAVTLSVLYVLIQIYK